MSSDLLSLSISMFAVAQALTSHIYICITSMSMLICSRRRILRSWLPIYCEHSRRREHCEGV